MSETEDHVKQAYTRTIPTNRTAEDGEITEPNDALKREMSSGRETARDHIDEDVQPAEGICFSPGPDPPDIQPGVGGLPATSSRSASRSEDRFTGLLTVCTECELHFGEQQAKWSACPICGDETLTTVEAAAFVCDGGESEDPVNEVYLSDSLKQLIVKECVICGETHRHGSKDRVVAEGGKSHRIAHCNGVQRPGGYYLKLADDADPPERWYNYVSLAGDSA